MIKKIAFTLGLIAFAAISFAQSGRISGTVMDVDANESVPFANVLVYLNGVQKGIAQTDIDGKFSVSPLDAGKYVVKISYLGNTKEVQGVIVTSGKTTRLDIEFTSATELGPVEVFGDPIVEVDKTSTGMEMTAEQIEKAPTRDVSSLISRGGNVTSSDDRGAVNIAGGRSEGAVIFINGVKQNTTNLPNLPMSAIRELQVLSGGISAQYGDVTSGVINITTKVGAEKMGGGIELETGAPFDAWNQSLAAVNLTGPIKTRTVINDIDMGEGNIVKDTVQETVVGFFVTGQYQYAKDPRPTVIRDKNGDFHTGVYTVKPDVMQLVEEQPLVPSGNGYLYRAETLTFDDLEISKARKNVANNSVQINGTMEYYPNNNMTVSLGGNLDYQRYHDYIAGYGLMNYGNNPLRNDASYNVWGRFRQTFGGGSNDTANTSMVKNAYYQIQFDYSVNKLREEDDNHKQNYFRYGHVGNFAFSDEYVKASKSNDIQTNYYYQREGSNNVLYNLNGDSLAAFDKDINNIYVNMTSTDDSYDFTDSEYNPLAARYVSYYQELNGGEPISLNQLVQDGLFFNGRRARLVHDLWYGPGREYNGFRIENEEQYRLSGMAAADVGKHNITFGFEYEQRARSTYSVSPLGLWALAESQVNNHLNNGFDYSNPTITIDDENSAAYVNYTFLSDPTAQTTFDKNLREKLDKDIDEQINIYDVNPDDLSIDMFTADEIIRFGSADWIGYDYTGKRQRGSNYSFTDFFYDKEFRPQASFRPIYTAFYVQDKFEINDMILRLGLRVDRYDANQVVLKDKYSTVALNSVGETDMNAFKNLDEVGDANRSALVEDDWVIYVDKSSEDLNNNQNSYTVVGFRDGDNWYDVEGNRVSDYSFIDNTNPNAPSNAEPYFTFAQDVTGDQKEIYDETSLDIEGAFTDFAAQINVMPRISFSFPVNDMATFFANYDVLTQRPNPDRTRVRPSDFYYLRQFQFVNNPDLRPQRQINYELGFKQALDKKQTVAMTLSASYRERKDEIQFTQVRHAYPGAYTTYGNIDFSTVKSGVVSIDTRRIKGMMINANYTISFADGTGSGANTARTLINQGLGNIKVPSSLDFDQRHAIKLNLDYRLDSGQGPKIFGRKLLQGAGASVQLNALSGRPYTKFANSQTSEVFLTTVGRSTLDGGINSSRLPWNNRVGLRIYKNYTVRGRVDALNVYAYVQNLFNTRNIIAVYNNTGSPDDDGFMAVRIDRNSITQAAADMYWARLTAPDAEHYSLPRRIRVGLSYNF